MTRDTARTWLKIVVMWGVGVAVVVGFGALMEAYPDATGCFIVSVFVVWVLYLIVKATGEGGLDVRR